MSDSATLNETLDTIGIFVRAKNPDVSLIMLVDGETGEVAILSHDLPAEVVGEFFHSLAHKYMDGDITVVPADRPNTLATDQA